MTIHPALSVAVVDDEADVRSALCDCLAIDGLAPQPFGDGAAALAEIGAQFRGIVLTDLRMPGTDGQAVFSRLRILDPDLPVIILTGHGDIDTAVDLMRRGAYDFIAKPFSADTLLHSVRRALEKRALVLENRKLLAQRQASANQDIAGESRFAKRLRETVALLAATDLPVLVGGEAGTGKSLIAALIHRKGRSGHKPAVTIDCSSLPAEHGASILFGHASGAFAGATMPRTGQIVRADGATLILDHVDRLPPPLQQALRHAIETRTVQPIGASHAVPFSARIIATCAATLAPDAASGLFDRSLYDLFAGYRLDLPALRENRPDVVPMFRHFVAAAAREAGKDVPLISPAVWRRLETHDWPGNVRELKSFAASVALGLGLDFNAPPPDPAADEGLKAALAGYEATLIRQALERHRGDIGRTIAALKLPRKTFYDRAARYGIDPGDYRDPLGRGGTLRS